MIPVVAIERTKLTLAEQERQHRQLAEQGAGHRHRPVGELRALEINVGMALDVAFTSRVRESLDADPGVHDPCRYLASAREGIADVVEGLLRDLAA